MGRNRSSQRQSSSKTSNSYQSSYSKSKTDNRSYKKVDSRKFSKVDQRQYTNIDSRDLSTAISNIDNSTVAKTALNCGIDTKDVNNFRNDESVNINQDNSQNIVITGDGNTLENISQKMNLTSYAPKIQKCLQDSLTKIASANVTNLSTKSSKKTDAKNSSDNSTTQKSDAKMESTNKISTYQKNKMKSDQVQKSDQSAKSTQSAGMAAAAAGGTGLLISLAILGTILYIYKDDYLFIKNNFTYIIYVILILSFFYKN